MIPKVDARLTQDRQGRAGVTALPRPRSESDVSVEEALARRRSIREFAPDALNLADAGGLLWAAQGMTGRYGRRTAPSAGALYPLEIYLVAGAVDELAPGVYHYSPRHHELETAAGGDQRARLATAALGQEWMAEASAVLVIAGDVGRTERKYGERAVRYMNMEVGAVAENIYLEATALDLGTAFVGAFHDRRVREVLDLPGDEWPLGLMPVGRPG